MAASQVALLKFEVKALARLEKVSIHVQFSGQGETGRVEAEPTHRKNAAGMFSREQGEREGGHIYSDSGLPSFA